MGDKDQEKSKEELEEQFDQEVKDAESNRMVVGYTCSNHEHIYYNSIMPSAAYKAVCRMKRCKECRGHLTKIPVKLGRTLGFENGYGIYPVQTRKKCGEWAEGKGEEWKEYSKEAYSKLK